MSGRKYSNEEKMAYIEEFKLSGLDRTKFAREKGIPETTFRGWLKLERTQLFGEIKLNPKTSEFNTLSEKTIIFRHDDIKLELRAGFDKQLLKSIVEVLVSDT